MFSDSKKRAKPFHDYSVKKYYPAIKLFIDSAIASSLQSIKEDIEFCRRNKLDFFSPRCSYSKKSKKKKFKIQETKLSIEQEFLEKYFFRHGVKPEEIEDYCAGTTLEDFISIMKLDFANFQKCGGNSDRIAKIFFWRCKESSGRILSFRKYLYHLIEEFNECKVRKCVVTLKDIYSEKVNSSKVLAPEKTNTGEVFPHETLKGDSELINECINKKCVVFMKRVDKKIAMCGKTIVKKLQVETEEGYSNTDRSNVTLTSTINNQNKKIRQNKRKQEDFYEDSDKDDECKVGEFSMIYKTPKKAPQVAIENKSSSTHSSNVTLTNIISNQNEKIRQNKRKRDYYEDSNKDDECKVGEFSMIYKTLRKSPQDTTENESPNTDKSNVVLTNIISQNKEIPQKKRNPKDYNEDASSNKDIECSVGENEMIYKTHSEAPQDTTGSESTNTDKSEVTITKTINNQKEEIPQNKRKQEDYKEVASSNQDAECSLGEIAKICETQNKAPQGTSKSESSNTDKSNVELTDIISQNEEIPQNTRKQKDYNEDTSINKDGEGSLGEIAMIFKTQSKRLPVTTENESSNTYRSNVTFTNTSSQNEEIPQSKRKQDYNEVAASDKDCECSVSEIAIIYKTQTKSPLLTTVNESSNTDRSNLTLANIINNQKEEIPQNKTVQDYNEDTSSDQDGECSESEIVKYYKTKHKAHLLTSESESSGTDMSISSLTNIINDMNEENCRKDHNEDTISIIKGSKSNNNSVIQRHTVTLPSDMVYCLNNDIKPVIKKSNQKQRGMYDREEEKKRKKEKREEMERNNKKREEMERKNKKREEIGRKNKKREENERKKEKREEKERKKEKERRKKKEDELYLETVDIARKLAHAYESLPKGSNVERYLQLRQKYKTALDAFTKILKNDIKVSEKNTNEEEYGGPSTNDVQNFMDVRQDRQSPIISTSETSSSSDSDLNEVCEESEEMPSAIFQVTVLDPSSYDEKPQEIQKYLLAIPENVFYLDEEAMSEVIGPLVDKMC